VDTYTIVTSDAPVASTSSTYVTANNPPAAPSTDPVNSRPHTWLSVLGVAVVLLVVYEVWRGNDAAAVVALIGVHAAVLLSTCFNEPWSFVRRTGPRRVLRASYILGILLGASVIFGSTNGPIKVLVLVVLCGLHSVAIASLLTIFVQVRTNWNSLSRARLVVWVAVAMASVFLCLKVDLRPTCGDATGCNPARAYEVFGISSGVYLFFVIATSLLTAIVTWNYLHPRLPRLKSPTLYALVGFAGFAAGAALMILTVVLTAWWRNNDPVEGPALHELPAIPAIAGDYVALGDSYSAGEGLQPFDAFTNTDTARLGNGCHRSAQAYSQLLRFEGPAPAERFVACSGAVTSDIFRQFTITDKSGNSIVVPPQVAPGTHPEVGLVTITIGGNDVVFSSVVTHCFLRNHCMEAPFQPPDDNPAREISLPPPAPLDTWALAAIDKVEAKMHKLYPELREAYPNARIVVVGYPYLFPDRDAPYWNLTDCQTILRRFTHAERVAVRTLQDRLNQVLHDEAAVAEIEFISPAAGWKDHEPCGTSEEQYTNSIKPFILSSDAGLTPGDGGTFHPNSAGQAELAKLVTCYLVAHPERLHLTVGGDPPGTETNPIADCASTG
jgi:lysophospholipase L1-like esterase